MKDNESFFYFLLAYWTWKHDTNSIFPKILYTLSLDDTVKLIKIFGGTTFKIPSWSDLSADLTEGLAAYLQRSEGCSPDYIKRLLKIKNAKRLFKNIKDWEDFINTNYQEESDE